MPAPKSLSFLPKPLLFALYGAAGGLLGALVFGELLYFLLTPAKADAAPGAQVAVAASKDVEVFVEGRNTFPVQIAREGFDGPVAIRLDGLPAGVSAQPVTIPAGKTEGEVVLLAARGAPVAAGATAKVVAEAGPEGKKASAEAPVTVKVTDPPRALADVAFVLDVSPKMQWAIDELKNGIGKFAGSLGKARIDFRLGLVTFQDVNPTGPKVEVVQFKGGPFTADSEVFREEVSQIRVAIGSGRDVPQCSLEAIAEACKLPYRKDATKVLLLITDAAPRVIPESNTAEAVRAAAKQVRDANIDAAHVVVWAFDREVYRPITEAGADKAGGRFFDLREVVVGDEGFDALLDTFGTAVTAAAIAKNPEAKPRVAERSKEQPVVKSLQSSVQTAAGSEGRIVLRSGVWTGAIAALVCLMLLGGQNHYLRGRLPGAGGIVLGLLGGLAAGAVGGAAGQGLYLVAKGGPVVEMVLQVLGWGLLGGLAGVGLSLFIPNMKWTHGLAGGAIGGAVGCAGYLAVSSFLRSAQMPATLADVLGRLAGGLALGFFIGLMVAVVESAFRRAWLEVRYGDRERISVTLGPEPVKVGSDARACTVWARGAAPVALRFFIRDGQVVCDDLTTGRESAVADGFAKEVGTLTVTVRTGSGGAPPEPPRKRKKLKPKKPEPLSLDEADDSFDLPMPAPGPTAPARPAQPEPKPAAPAARPPRPTAGAKPAAPPLPKPPAPPAPKVPGPPAPKPAAPPAAPAIKAPAKNPDACPGCGRAIPGKPGQRYCMICDQTF